MAGRAPRGHGPEEGPHHHRGRENISPSRVEDVVAESPPLVDQVLVVGDGRPFLVALVVPDFAELAHHGLHGLPEEVVADPRTRALLDAVLDTANQKLAKAEQVRAHAVLAQPWTSDSGELTPTQKLRRRTVEESNRALVDRLYAATRSRDRHADSTPTG